MSSSNTQKIIEKAYADNASKLVQWALRKLKSLEDAEDFCSDVMSRFTKAVIAKEAKGEDITSANDYLWVIAHHLMKEYHTSSERKDKLMEELENDLVGTQFIASETASENDYGEGEDPELLLQKLRLSIAHLEYNMREAVIMYHLEKKSLSEIGKKLHLTESYVKKLLFEGKLKIRENEKKDLYQVGKEYRSKWMNITPTGAKKDTYSFDKISDSLTKQNICRACYDKPHTIEEIGFMLGLPSSYIEWDLKWLVDRGFVVKKRDKYATAFFIYSWSFVALIMNMFYKHKTHCIDKVIDRLATLSERLKEIGFIGSDRPINQLLWLLIYNFVRIAIAQIYYEEHGCAFDNHDKKTGEPYYFIGSFNSYDSESNKQLDPLFLADYLELIEWGDDPIYDHTDGENSSRWYPVVRGEQYIAGMAEPFEYIDFLYKVCKMGFVVDGLSGEEREMLGKCIEKGYLSVGTPLMASVGSDGINAVPTNVLPNFYVFTPAQRARFDELLTECVDDVIVELRELYQDLRKMCKEVLPPQVADYLDFVAYNSLGYLKMFATGFAFYDGKLSVEEGKGDFTMLGMSVTV